jgi:hypothetical protein
MYYQGICGCALVSADAPDIVRYDADGQTQSYRHGRQPPHWENEMRAKFAQEAVEAVGGNWTDVQQFNGALDRLCQRRQSTVAPEGDLLRSTLVWKIVVFEQSIL